MSTYPIEKHVYIRNSYYRANGKELSGGDVLYLQEKIEVGKNVRAKQPNPLTDTVMVIVRQQRNVGRYRNGPYAGEVNFVWNGPSDTKLVADTSGEKAFQVQRALANLGSGPLDAGVAIAELDSTIDTIKKNLNRLSDGLYAATIGDLDHADRTLGLDMKVRDREMIRSLPKSQRASRLWLEYSLGIVPILSDIYGAIDLYHKGLREKGHTVGGASGQKQIRKDLYQPQPPRLAGSSTTRDNIGSMSQIEMWPPVSRATIRGKVRNPTLANLQALGFLNPLALAWEKTPLSWLVDYVIPIGDLLRTMTATAGLEGLRGSFVSEKRWETTKRSNGVWVSSRQEITRELITDFGPLSSMQALLPHVEPSFTKLANALAIFVTRVRP